MGSTNHIFFCHRGSLDFWYMSLPPSLPLIAAHLFLPPRPVRGRAWWWVAPQPRGLACAAVTTAWEEAEVVFLSRQYFFWGYLFLTILLFPIYNTNYHQRGCPTFFFNWQFCFLYEYDLFADSHWELPGREALQDKPRPALASQPSLSGKYRGSH